ncbi:MAG TPA: hypothetical protein PKD79_02905, partial [Candidatus Doudnabacteria bacterium]|nr:hypothetical protein [Candidatus Doudnabacteria bacterium]
ERINKIIREEMNNNSIEISKNLKLSIVIEARYTTDGWIPESTINITERFANRRNEVRGGELTQADWAIVYDIARSSVSSCPADLAILTQRAKYLSQGLQPPEDSDINNYTILQQVFRNNDLPYRFYGGNLVKLW